MVAFLWGSPEEYQWTGNNWNKGKVDNVTWPGRQFSTLPSITFMSKPSNYKGWCSNMGSDGGDDYDLQDVYPTTWTFGNDGMIKLPYSCKDYGAHDSIQVKFVNLGFVPGRQIAEMKTGFVGERMMGRMEQIQ